MLNIYIINSRSNTTSGSVANAGRSPVIIPSGWAGVRSPLHFLQAFPVAKACAQPDLWITHQWSCIQSSRESACPCCCSWLKLGTAAAKTGFCQHPEAWPFSRGRTKCSNFAPRGLSLSVGTLNPKPCPQRIKNLRSYFDREKLEVTCRSLPQTPKTSQPLHVGAFLIRRSVWGFLIIVIV